MRIPGMLVAVAAGALALSGCGDDTSTTTAAETTAETQTRTNRTTETACSAIRTGPSTARENVAARPRPRSRAPSRGLRHSTPRRTNETTSTTAAPQ